MTARAYLGQAYRLENRIRNLKHRIIELRELATTVSSPGFGEHYNVTQNTDAPYVKSLEKIMLLEDEVNTKLLLLLNLQKQIENVIAQLGDVDLQLVLTYRYIHNFSWYKIGVELSVDESTARRWHDKAIARVVVPDNAIKI